MNLADMLNYADIQQLNRIASLYECQCNSHSKNELIQSILSKIFRSEVSEKWIHDSSIEELRFLYSLLFDQRNSYSLEELLARAELSRREKNEHDAWNPREMITRFKHRGWLFNGFTQQNRYLFHMPKDLKNIFSNILSKRFQDSIERIDEPPSIYRDEQWLIRDDIFQFLKYIFHHEVKLTHEGVIYKRYIQQIFEQFSVKEPLVPKAGWRFGYGRRFKEYPSRFSFLYDYCYFRELIVEQGDQLLLTEKGMQVVTSQSQLDLTDIYRFWIQLYKRPIPGLQSFVHWIDQLAPVWVTVSSLQRTLCPFIRPYYYDQPESILEQRILQMMMHLGLLKIGEHEYHGTVVQTTELGHQMIRGTFVEEGDAIEFAQE